MQATRTKHPTTVGLFFLRDLDFANVYMAWPPCFCPPCCHLVGTDECKSFCVPCFYSLPHPLLHNIIYCVTISCMCDVVFINFPALFHHMYSLIMAWYIFIYAYNYISNSPSLGREMDIKKRAYTCLSITFGNKESDLTAKTCQTWEHPPTHLTLDICGWPTSCGVKDLSI